MDNPAINVMDSLCGDLDASARRRMWLVGQVIGRSTISELQSALEAVAKLEMFIGRGYPSTDKAPFSHAGRNGHSGQPLAQPSPGLHIVARPADAAALGARQRIGYRPLLDGQKRDQFIREAARNSDNRHLAQVFNLTVRQAHAIRVGLSKSIDRARGEQPTIAASSA